MPAIPDIRCANSGMTRKLLRRFRNNSLHRKGWVAVFRTIELSGTVD